MSHPRLGEHVYYTLDEGDAYEINKRRQAANLAAFGDRGEGELLPRTGNSAHEGEQFPAVLVKKAEGLTWNLQVTLDGNDTHWATGRPAGDGPGHWQTRVSL